MYPLASFDVSIIESPDFKEDSVREEIIAPILSALGYSASGSYKIIRSKSLLDPYVNMGTRRREVSIPDYLMQIEGKPFWVLDAKAPNETITSGKHVEQAHSYATHIEIQAPLFALCNGKEFSVFRTNDRRQPVLYFHISDIAHYWKKLYDLLSPSAFVSTRTKPSEETAIPKQVDYMAIKPLTEIKKIEKQSAKRHFGVHGYFTKQAYRVVREYILNFSRPGDVVLDPFGGSGVTLIEALILSRKAIHIDINALSVFIVENLIQPVSIESVNKALVILKHQYETKRPKSETEVKKALELYDYPTGILLPKGSDVETIEQLFSKRQLAELALLKHLIHEVKDLKIRNCLLLAFSSAITKTNLTYHPSSSRGENAGDSAAFRYYRYRIAPEPVELNLWNTFKTKIDKLIAAKKEIAPFITESTIKNAQVIKGNATNLYFIPDESVDYIYTDPPYGSKIAYLDLSVMWTAWLDLPVTEEDYENEAIEGGEHGKTKLDYSQSLTKSIREMYRVLKFDRWMSFVFAHKDPAYWHLIVDAAEKAGFEYAGAVKQNNGQSTFKKRQNPFTVLKGQLIINFKKVANPQAIMRISLGENVTSIVMETIESTIAQHHGATLEEINDELVLRGLELGFLDVLSKEYQDLTPLLLENFDFDEKSHKYQLRKNTKFRTHVPVELRVRYYLLSYLRRMQREGYQPTFDEIVFNIMPLLKNGITPENQTILSVLEDLAERVGDDRWQLKNTGQTSLFPGM